MNEHLAAQGVDYLTPESADGTLVSVTDHHDGTVGGEVEFRLRPQFRDQIAGDLDHVIFASRSRLARLGIEARPTSRLELSGDVLRMSVELNTTVSEYGVAPFLSRLAIPGLAVGRLVYCPPDQVLSAEEVKAAMQERLLQLPRGFSLGSDGSLLIRPHHVTYGLTRPLDVDDLMSIVFREDGRALLSMLQAPRQADTLEVPPHDGVITSCSMFLHRHYMVIENRTTNTAQHLQAVALDPVHTRGTRIFLEFFNPSDQPVLNPWATARLYRAQPTPLKRWPVVQVPAAHPGAPAPTPYASVRESLDRLEGDGPEGSAYFRRTVAVMDRMDRDPTLSTLAQLQAPQALPVDRVFNYAARGQEHQTVLQADRFATANLHQLPPDAGKCLILSYFPNFVEHIHLCTAALSRRISQIVFRRASFEHGMFLSARDHGRLSDYAALGVDVFWADDDNQELLRHVMVRGRRGFFVSAGVEAKLRSSLLFSFYGSARPLPEVERAKVEALIGRLTALFGPNVGILTGGGPGAMQQATEAARKYNLITGASFIETADQGTIKNVDFFQTFQDRSRHYRQRWFDVSSFQVFCIGGVGTLEEIGQTFTDVKLGMIERGPLVFFGSTDGDHYWRHQVEMLKRMARDGRAPEWINSHVLLSDDPEEVIRFYRQTLDLA
jgi:predicted Rossmann-fold nucleotide-binding protein